MVFPNCFHLLILFPHNSKLLNLIKDLNFEFTDLEAGIKTTVNYLINNYNDIRK